MNTIKNKKIWAALVVASMAVLPGCNWFKKGCCGGADDDLVQQGEILASMNGKRIISDKSLDRDFEQLLQENPQLRQVLTFMPDAKKNFLQGMVSQNVVDQYVADNKIDQQDDYQNELNRMTRSVKRMLNTKYFTQAYTVKVTDEEAKKYYEENKANMPDLMVSRGGFKTEGVSFAKEADAQAFLAKTQGKCCFQKMAKEAGLKVQDFKMVNAETVGVSPVLRNAIAAFDKAPKVEMVKADGKVWVVNAYEKVESQFRPYEQVAAGLKQYVEKERSMAKMDKEITQLKEHYQVVVNEDSLKAKQQAHDVADAAAQAPAVAQAA